MGCHNSVDVVFELEVTFICLVPHGWGVGGRWWQPYPSLVIPHVWVQRRATGQQRLADQVIYGAQNKVITIALPFFKESTLRRTSLPKLSFSCSWGELSLETSYTTVPRENTIPCLSPGEVLQRYFRALVDLSTFAKKHQQSPLSPNHVPLVYLMKWHLPISCKPFARLIVRAA
jgi:hypothetical protein